MPRFFLTKVTVEGFRGINNDSDPLSLSFRPDAVNSVFAPNAQGKSSVFEAVCYAIKGYMVASRTSEIGIRMALGAAHGSIVGMVLREGLVLTTVGLVGGLGMGLGVAKVAARFLYGISPVDPVSIVVTLGLLGSASLLASSVPARRAAKVDPMVALRYE